ncbi:hypothetical protein [Actinomadura rayongensis]|uniref:Uncharacterized protein n=1 Tax=Actinomadura rayongensis TaxID=1429076 RepID=A0A6I4WCI2_9ACTN|nr:hypothetical protein [Actinomadura rayongensis]MXQ66550.1 hypothetical protein [Actinomadura rayongensis]
MTMITSLPRVRTARRTGHLPRLLLAAGAALVPWACALAARLPATAEAAHWATAWTGLDLMIAAGFVATGTLLRRGDPRHALTAAGTAALLAADAWFDVLTAAPGADRTVAITLAAVAEIPLAALCCALALRAFPPATSPNLSAPTGD